MKMLIIAALTTLSFSSSFAGPREDYTAASNKQMNSQLRQAITEALAKAGKDASRMQIEEAVSQYSSIIGYASDATDACVIHNDYTASCIRR